jgi:hypothetical protein
MTERELLVDCLRRLNGLCITYYLTGSMASNYWGIPRTTHDLDFVIQLPPSSVDKIVSAPCAKSNCYPRRSIVVPKGCYPMALVFG